MCPHYRKPISHPDSVHDMTWDAIITGHGAASDWGGLRTRTWHMMTKHQPMTRVFQVVVTVEIGHPQNYLDDNCLGKRPGWPSTTAHPVVLLKAQIQMLHRLQ